MNTSGRGCPSQRLQLRGQGLARHARAARVQRDGERTGWQRGQHARALAPLGLARRAGASLISGTVSFGRSRSCSGRTTCVPDPAAACRPRSAACNQRLCTIRTYASSWLPARRCCSARRAPARPGPGAPVTMQSNPGTQADATARRLSADDLAAAVARRQAAGADRPGRARRRAAGAVRAVAIGPGMRLGRLLDLGLFVRAWHAGSGCWTAPPAG